MSLKHIIILSFLFILTLCGSLYQILEIQPTATQFDIKKAFRKMSIKYHPDRNPGDTLANKKYLEINRAFQVLSDSTKRVTYDNFGEEGLFDLQNKAKPKGGDYRTGMDVTLQDLYNGAKKVFGFRRGELCKTCKGTGDATAMLSTCSQCNGSGHLSRKIKVNGDNKLLSFKCPKCEGKGKSNQQICPVCKGKKITIQHRDLSFNIEPGRELWKKQFFKGQSEQGIQFYPGDVILTLKMRPHERFVREHQHLYTTLTISLEEALLGFDKPIKHLDGTNVMVSSDGITNNEQQIVLEGKGMPIPSDPGTFGNLYVKIIVDYNFNFNAEQMRLIKKVFENKKNQTPKQADTSSENDIQTEL